MKTFFAVMLCVVGVSMAAGISTADAAGGCGAGWHRNAYGRCVQNWAVPAAHACARGWHVGPGGACVANWARPAYHACARGWHLNRWGRCVANY